MTGDEARSAVLAAVLSRPERWDVTRVELPGASRPVVGWRLSLHGDLVIDGEHARAIGVTE